MASGSRGNPDMDEDGDRIFATYCETTYALCKAYREKFPNLQGFEVFSKALMDVGKYIMELPKQIEAGNFDLKRFDPRLFLEECGAVLANRSGVLDQYQAIREDTRIVEGGS